VDAIVFGMKRASAVMQYRFLAPLLRDCALTPARFDLMFGLRKGRVLQSELRRELGVSRPTVSRMLASLEGLGFVNRWPEKRGRTRSVLLTQLGRAVLRHALHRIMRKKIVRRVLDALFDFERRCLLEGYCHAIQKRFGDSASFFYPWHPDD
jgi:DNA-binding MarR family transcriptional regulator